jgi:membrane-bound ClpP family serine protease
MKLLLLVSILGFIGALSLALVVALWRYKKSRLGSGRLIGKTASVSTSLNPDGSVLVDGELWPARSTEGELITAGSRVRVVEVQDHGVLVERCD